MDRYQLRMVKETVKKLHPKHIRMGQQDGVRAIGAAFVALVVENTGWHFGPFTHEFLVWGCGMFLARSAPDLADFMKGGGK